MITRTAPGKLFVAGEYAVLRPAHPAVLVAVDRYVTVTIDESHTEGATLTSDLSEGRLRCSREAGRLVPVAGADRQHFDYVLAAARVVERLLIETGGKPRSFTLTVTGRPLTDGGRHKLGLGSSAAVTVGTVSALAEFYRLRVGLMQRYRLAMLATVTVNPDGSGGDIAAATWGGYIAYRSPDRSPIREFVTADAVSAALQANWPGLSVQPIAPPQRTRLLVGWTGTPASTPALTASIRNSHQDIDDPSFFIGSCTTVQRLVTSLTKDDVLGTQREIRTSRLLLYTLAENAGLGLRTTRLDALCNAAERAGAAAKPSGAGGGDCGIAVVDHAHPEQAAEIAEHWLAADIRPVPIRIHPGEKDIQ